MCIRDSEVETLKALVEKKESKELNSLFSMLVDRKDSDQYIRHYVYLSLSDISGFSPDLFNDNSDLRFDLGLGLYHKRALKNYFQKIVSDLNSTRIITVKECEDLKKVRDCLKLIKSKI